MFVLKSSQFGNFSIVSNHHLLTQAVAFKLKEKVDDRENILAIWLLHDSVCLGMDSNKLLDQIHSANDVTSCVRTKLGVLQQ